MVARMQLEAEEATNRARSECDVVFGRDPGAPLFDVELSTSSPRFPLSRLFLFPLNPVMRFFFAATLLTLAGAFASKVVDLDDKNFDQVREE